MAHSASNLQYMFPIEVESRNTELFVKIMNEDLVGLDVSQTLLVSPAKLQPLVSKPVSRKGQQSTLEEYGIREQKRKDKTKKEDATDVNTVKTRSL